MSHETCIKVTTQRGDERRLNMLKHTVTQTRRGVAGWIHRIADCRQNILRNSSGQSLHRLPKNTSSFNSQQKKQMVCSFHDSRRKDILSLSATLISCCNSEHTPVTCVWDWGHRVGLRCCPLKTTTSSSHSRRQTLEGRASELQETQCQTCRENFNDQLEFIFSTAWQKSETKHPHITWLNIATIHAETARDQWKCF